MIPILYLKGLSTGDFRPALEGLLGEDAARLSATTVSRMCKEWEEHHARFRQQLLSFTAWAALRDLFPSSGEQRRWFHASGNVIDALPKWLQSRAKGFLNHLRPQDAPGATQRPRSLRGPTTHAATPPAGASLVAVDDDRQRPAHRRALICERSCGKRSIEPPCR